MAKVVFVALLVLNIISIGISAVNLKRINKRSRRQ